MTMLQSVRTALRKYGDFSSLATRTEFWLLLPMAGVIVLVLHLAQHILEQNRSSASIPFMVPIPQATR